MQFQLKSSEPHPQGVFVGTITRVVDDGEGKFGPQCKIGIKTEAGELCVLCSQTYSAKSKLGKIVAAAIGDLPENLVTEALVGAKLTVVVEHERVDEAVYDRVTNFLPAGRSGAADLFAGGD